MQTLDIAVDKNILVKLLSKIRVGIRNRGPTEMFPLLSLCDFCKMSFFTIPTVFNLLSSKLTLEDQK